MRNILNTPAPRVIAWDSTGDNSVGSEYIIMEKAEGVQLSEIWSELEPRRKSHVLVAVGKYQRE